MLRYPTLRRVRYSLRTLIIATALAGLVFSWVAYQLNWIRQRREIIASPKFRYTVARPSYDDDTRQTIWVSPNAPWQLRMFGETGYTFISVHIIGDVKEFPLISSVGTVTEECLYPEQLREVERVRRLFPEANVMIFPP